MIVPRPAAWASAVALFVLAAGVSVAMAFIMPLLLGLIRHAPRLAYLGMLATWLSPIAAAAAIHAVVRELGDDVRDGGRAGELRNAGCKPFGIQGARDSSDQAAPVQEYVAEALSPRARPGVTSMTCLGAA